MALTQERAEARSAAIKHGSIHYDLHVALETGTHYDGLSQLTFELVSVPHELFIDCKSGEIKALWVNGSVTPITHTDGFIILDVTKLKIGQNTVGVYYRNKYDNDGSGCVSFTDVDGKQYLYTQFQAYYANRVFALFDQPDLKAKMNLNVIAPAAWKKVLSNEYATVEKPFEKELYLQNVHTSHKELLQIYLNGKEGSMSLFPVTKLLPSYLFCFIAGEYLELKLEHTYKGIPMSLYCIGSLYQHLEKLAPFIFEITIESMKFFEKFFGYEFAFAKYDQVFAHQYKWGAMENAGIVTFNDLYIFKEKVSTDRMLSFANTISHELAHHWFGNLVTMRWWDDLWLNESFADFISHFCLQKIRGEVKTLNYESSMSAFLQRKGWGYHEDQMITTHSIRGEVANTSVADSIFDGITYSKGAATMKQLLYLMTEDNFSKALSQYFHKYEWKNATIEDFLAQMQQHFTIAQFTLTEWRKLWLQKPSLNIIQAHWDPTCHTPHAKITIRQGVYTEQHPTLRYHKIKIGLFKSPSEVDVIETVLYPREENIAEYDGSVGYKAILLNYEDHTFVKNVIDPVSLEFFSIHINEITDILSRTLIWRSFFEMIKDAKMTSDKYVDVVVKQLVAEKSDTIFEKQFDFVYTAINNYTPKRLREPLNSRMFQFVLGLIPTVKEENRLVILKGKLVAFAHTEEEKKLLLEWKQGKVPALEGHAMTNGQQWSTVVKAFTMKTLKLEQKEAIFEAQRVIDPSDTAKNKRLTIDSLKANQEQFEKIYLSFQAKQTTLSVTNKHHIAAGWNHEYHSQRLLNYRKRYFEDMVKLSKVLEGDHFEAFYENLGPIDDDLASQIVEYSNIKFEGDHMAKHNREILKIIDNLKRKQKAYHLYPQPAL